MTIYYPGNRDNFGNQGIFADGASADLTGRHLVSRSDCIMQWSANSSTQFPVPFNQLTSTGGTVSWGAPSAIFTATTGVGSTAMATSRAKMPTPTGRTMRVMFTALMGASVTNTNQILGLFAQTSGTPAITYGFALSSGVKIVHTPNTGAVTQSNWNIDKFDGTGISGITIDWSKLQTFVIEYQFPHIMRFGFLLNGQIRYCHITSLANVATSLSGFYDLGLFIASYNNAGFGSASNTVLTLYDVSVHYDGGIMLNAGQQFSISTEETNRTVTASLSHLCTIKYASNLANYGFLKLLNLDLFSNSANSIWWGLYISQTMTGAGSFTQIPGSRFTVDKTSTILPNGSIPPMVFLRSGYIGTTTRSNLMDLSADPIYRLGTQINSSNSEFLTLCAKNISGGSANVLFSLNFTEYF